MIDEIEVGGVILRHRAKPGEIRPELSGHWHPKLTVVHRGRRIARPCAVASETRMVLPAFGALTGGMNGGKGRGTSGKPRSWRTSTRNCCHGRVPRRTLHARHAATTLFNRPRPPNERGMR